jgi:hypothetical protein
MTAVITLGQVQELLEHLGFSPKLNRNGRSFSITACTEKEKIEVHYFGTCWITLDIHLSNRDNGAVSYQPWDLLYMNSKIHGPGRFIQKQYSSFGIRADVVSSGNASELADALKAALESIEHARALCNGSNGRDAMRSRLDPAHLENIRALCVEADFDFIESQNGSAIRLKVPGGIYHAYIEEDTSGGYFIKVMLATVDDWKPESKDALSNMLLSVSDRIKMVRASRFVRDHGSEHVFFECYLGENASVLEVDLALSSLSVACQTVKNEVEAMRSALIAGEYLAFISWPSVKKKSLKERSKNHESDINIGVK